MTRCFVVPLKKKKHISFPNENALSGLKNALLSIFNKCFHQKPRKYPNNRDDANDDCYLKDVKNGYCILGS